MGIDLEFLPYWQTYLLFCASVAHVPKRTLRSGSRKAAHFAQPGEIHQQKYAIFLDRDGVINPEIYYPDTKAFESPRTTAEFTLMPQVIEALHHLQKAGFLLFLVSNQPNAAKGKASMETLVSIHETMAELLHKENITFMECFYCYHHPDFTGACDCRKPSPYFLLQAKDTYHLDMAGSWMIGDRDTDIECGQNAGVRTLKIGPDVANLFEASRVIIADAAGVERR